MLRSKFFKALMASAAVAFGVTAAIVTLSTTGPSPAQAHIPEGMLQSADSGQVPSLAPMLKSVLPAVVNISVSGEMAVQQNPLMQDPFFRRFFNQPGQQQQQQQQQQQEFKAIGSGVIVNADKGYVLTNNHVVVNATSIKVTLQDGRDFKAKLIGRDPETDIAVLQIKAKSLTALPMADSSKLQVGDFVVAVGDPFGLGQTVTSGIVSALSRTTSMSGYQDFIQTDASINPGNSGGALVNLKGQLVGVNSEILSRSGGNIGIGFAIPSDLARTIMDQLIAHGKVVHGHIGVMIQNLTPELAKALGVNTDHGVVVSRVMSDSPAQKAGLKNEDVIVAANGKKVTDALELRNAVGLLEIGHKVDLTVLRGDKTLHVDVTVGKMQSLSASNDNLFSDLQGASYSPLQARPSTSGPNHGIAVGDVKSGSPADQAGLQNGDIIVSVNRQPVSTIEQFQKLAGKNQPQLLLRVVRGPGALFLLLTH